MSDALRALQGRPPARPRRPPCAAASTRRSPPTRRPARSPRTGRCRSPASAASSPAWAGPPRRWPPTTPPSRGRPRTRPPSAAGPSCWPWRGRGPRPPTRSTCSSPSWTQAGRLGEAADAGRRALELAESRSRRARRGGPGRPAPRGRRHGRRRTRSRAALGIAPGSRQPRRRAGARSATAPGRPVGRGRAGGHRRRGARQRRPRRGPPAAISRPRRPSGRSGTCHAALDACYLALAVAPAAGDVHLALAELYLDRGWRSAAADKLVLLGRLTDLAADDLTRARLCTMAAERFPEDARLTAFCA